MYYVFLRDISAQKLKHNKMAKVKVKVFPSARKEKLEKDVNDFLATIDPMQIHRVEYQTTRVNEDTATTYSCMLFYTFDYEAVCHQCSKTFYLMKPNLNYCCEACRKSAEDKSIKEKTEVGGWTVIEEDTIIGHDNIYAWFEKRTDLLEGLLEIIDRMKDNSSGQFTFQKWIIEQAEIKDQFKVRSEEFRPKLIFTFKDKEALLTGVEKMHERNLKTMAVCMDEDSIQKRKKR